MDDKDLEVIQNTLCQKISLKDKDSKEKVYASIYDSTGKDNNLYPIETEKEWNLIFNVLESIQKKLEEEQYV